MTDDDRRERIRRGLAGQPDPASPAPGDAIAQGGAAGWIRVRQDSAFDVTPDVLRQIEELYTADREVEALQIIDSILKLQASYDDQVRRLQSISADPDWIHVDGEAEQTPGATIVSLQHKLGGGALWRLMDVRSRCLASGISLTGELRSTALDHCKLLLQLYGHHARAVVYAAQIMCALDLVTEAIALVQKVVDQDPRDEHAKGTLDSIRRRADTSRKDRVKGLMARVKALQKEGWKAGELTAWTLCGLLAGCSELSELLESNPEDTQTWVFLLSVLMNIHRHDDAAMVLRTIQSLNPAPDVCDGLLGAGATQRITNDLRSAFQSGASSGAPVSYAECMRKVRQNLHDFARSVADPAPQQWVATRLLPWVDAGEAPGPAERVVMRFLLAAGAGSAGDAPELFGIHRSLLHLGTDDVESAREALRRAWAERPRTGEGATDYESAVGSLVQALMQRSEGPPAEPSGS